MIETIDKDELTLAAIQVDSLRYLSGDIMDDFFDLYDPNNKEDAPSILYGFCRARAMGQAIFTMIYDLEQGLKRVGIYR